MPSWVERLTKHETALIVPECGNVLAPSLRRGLFCHVLDRGASMALVRDSMGHSSVSTTNGYLHARPNDSSALYLAV